MSKVASELLKPRTIFEVCAGVSLLWVCYEFWVVLQNTLDVARPLWASYIGAPEGTFATRCVFNLSCLKDLSSGFFGAYPLLPPVLLAVTFTGALFAKMSEPRPTKKEPGEADFAREGELGALKAPGDPKKKVS